MRSASLLLVAATCFASPAPPQEPPLSDKRFSIYTLVREDFFAGILEGDMSRLARGEKSLETLMQQRPNDKPGLLALKSGIELYRAVLALEANSREEFERKYKEATDLMTEAQKINKGDPGVSAVIGGMYVMMADRLPEKYRASAWSTAFESYQKLMKLQEKVVDSLPNHLRGELLGGMAESAQRTGKTREMNEAIDKLIAIAPDSAYGKVAKKWKEDPTIARSTRMTCLSCHNQGRLAARQAALDKK
jgi:hypothetical protein